MNPLWKEEQSIICFYIQPENSVQRHEYTISVPAPSTPLHVCMPPLLLNKFWDLISRVCQLILLMLKDTLLPVNLITCTPRKLLLFPLTVTLTGPLAPPFAASPTTGHQPWTGHSWFGLNWKKRLHSEQQITNATHFTASFKHYYSEMWMKLPQSG